MRHHRRRRRSRFAVWAPVVGALVLVVLAFVLAPSLQPPPPRIVVYPPAPAPGNEQQPRNGSQAQRLLETQPSRAEAPRPVAETAPRADSQPQQVTAERSQKHVQKRRVPAAPRNEGSPANPSDLTLR